MPRIGIVAAFHSELRPVVRGWERRGSVWLGRIGPVEVRAACAGMGSAAVTRACDQIIGCPTSARGSQPWEQPIDTLVSVGFAGSLSCGLKPPEACAVREVIDAATGERFPTLDPDGQRLITLDHVADPLEKRRLAEKFQAVLVDMEAAAVARFARSHSLGFSCVKAVTDGPNDQLPDFNRFTGPDGQLRLPALILHALTHPQTWSPLRRLARNSSAAAEELAVFMSRRIGTSK
ncbi:MAG: hypothetical protein WBG54_08775 [Acidobacteriaceae bacterium]